MTEIINEEIKDLFNEELNKEDDSDDENICLINYDKLLDNYITLTCGHRFNYIPLYKEIINQKSHRLHHRLRPYHIKCPFCRNVHAYILPYIKMDGVEKIDGVNSPDKYALLQNKCQYIPKSGKNKKVMCNARCFHTYCTRHIRYISK